MIINDINLQIIADSRGNPTLEATFKSATFSAISSVPSGKSIGSREAYVLDPQRAWVKFAALKFNLLNRDFGSIEEFDKFLIALDGTPGKQSFGGNLILVLSIGFSKLLAQEAGVELYDYIAKLTGNKIQKLPLCFYNLIEGGVHAQNSLPFQEYLLIPKTSSPKMGLESVQKMIQVLQSALQQQFGQAIQGDEGGFTLPSQDPLAGLHLLQDIRNKTELMESMIGLDVAASTFFEDGEYKVGEKVLSREDLNSLYKQIAADFPILSIEDPFEENDWPGFENLNRELGSKLWIVGDDLTTTNPGRIEEAYQKGAVNAVIIKPNQIGSVSESIKASLIAKTSGWKIIVSHRSGETMDTFIADLAVGLGADGLKSGCPLQKERLVKYQRLIEIEERI